MCFFFSQVPGELGGSGLDASGTPGPSAERSPGPPPVPALPAPPTPPDNPQNEEERRQVTLYTNIWRVERKILCHEQKS